MVTELCAAGAVGCSSSALVSYGCEAAGPGSPLLLERRADDDGALLGACSSSEGWAAPAWPVLALCGSGPHCGTGGLSRWSSSCTRRWCLQTHVRKEGRGAKERMSMRPSSTARGGPLQVAAGSSADACLAHMCTYHIWYALCLSSWHCAPEVECGLRGKVRCEHRSGRRRKAAPRAHAGVASKHRPRHPDQRHVGGGKQHPARSAPGRMRRWTCTTPSLACSG